ncbi:RagB/SusD family nutrient uptake outer membrane protein [Segetibacter sp. 3557_3]|uniref:RagB/SusD family nutrient uptake outer membrane protein n=1 Tax=Segetibacter sp. 3557_3 TaxID=2547429 RepID=UPI001404F0B2|nr:RagB/SusD family nutrient uptake outer membrane protein [Segetibacter sp. 3557_3]
MKKFLIIIGLSAGLISCSKSGFLDNKSTALDEAQVFSDSSRTIQFLSRIYSDIGFSFNKGRWSSHGNTELATDDAEYSLSGPTQAAVALYNGTISPTNLPSGLGDFWSTPYANIRRCNLLLSKLSTTPLSAGMQARMRGESRFLRAWYYSQLMIAYGGVPNVEDKVFGIEDVVSIPRANFADLVSYLAKELDEAGESLPATNYDFADTRDFGRATKGACMALKARILLYAASPLFNGGSIATNPELAKLVSYPVASVSHWQAAADAALAVINSGYYALWNPTSTIAGYGFYQTFLNGRPAGTGTMNRELIFGVMRPSGKDFENYYNPGGGSFGGTHYSVPTQNLVDAFPMMNGKAITDPASGYQPNNPYEGRDPRFRFSIIYHQSRYAQNTALTVINASVGSQQGFSAGTVTGYFSRKMLDSTFSSSSSTNIDRPWPLIRYAEMLLNYAEAINEAGQTAMAYPRLIELRSRAGILPGADGLFGLKANMSQAEMRALIQNERRIELAFEDHRFNDIRRWKIAMAVNNGYNRVVKITGTAPNWVYTYSTTQEVQASRLHVFRPEMHLLPIPDDEIRKNPAVVQNPGW